MPNPLFSIAAASLSRYLPKSRTAAATAAAASASASASASVIRAAPQRPPRLPLPTCPCNITTSLLAYLSSKIITTQTDSNLGRQSTARNTANMSTMPAQHGHSEACCNIPPIVSSGYDAKGSYDELGGYKTCRCNWPSFIHLSHSSPGTLY